MQTIETVIEAVEIENNIWGRMFYTMDGNERTYHLATDAGIKSVMVQGYLDQDHLEVILSAWVRDLAKVVGS